MSTEPSQAARSCYSKKRYSTEKYAQSVARRVQWERGDILRAYICFECGGYHLTKRPTWEEQAVRGLPTPPVPPPEASAPVQVPEPPPAREPVPNQLPIAFRLYARGYARGTGWMKGVNLGSYPIEDFQGDVHLFIKSDLFHTLIEERLRDKGIKCDMAVIVVKFGKRFSAQTSWTSKEINGKAQP